MSLRQRHFDAAAETNSGEKYKFVALKNKARWEIFQEKNNKKSIPLGHSEESFANT